MLNKKLMLWVVVVINNGKTDSCTLGAIQGTKSSCLKPEHHDKTSASYIWLNNLNMLMIETMFIYHGIPALHAHKKFKNEK